MAGETYNALTDTDLSEGKSFSFLDARKIRDNPLALWQGDASAPVLPQRTKGIVAHKGVGASASLTTQQDNLAVGSVAAYRYQCDAAHSLTGIAAGEIGRELRLVNSGSAPLTLAHEDASSTAANRFDLAQDTSITLRAGGVLLLRYDGTLSRWQVVGAQLATLTAFGRSLIDDADAATARGTLGLGTIATQAASSVAITGGTIDGTVIGGSTAAAGSFTTLGASGIVTLTNTTASTGVGTGALQVAGGIYVGGTSAFDGTVTLNGPFNINAAAGSNPFFSFQRAGTFASAVISPAASRIELVDQSSGRMALFASNFVTFPSGSPVYVDDTSTATATNTGALRVTGGIWAGAASFLEGAVKFGGINNYAATMGNSTKSPTTDAPADWVEVQIGGTTRYLPAYAA